MKLQEKKNFSTKVLRVYLLWFSLKFWGLKKMQKRLHSTMGWFSWLIGGSSGEVIYSNWCPLTSGELLPYMHRQCGRPVKGATFPEWCLQLIEEPESLQGFQRNIAFLEALSGLALLYVVTSGKVLALYRRLSIFALLSCVSFIFHVSFQHECLKKIILFISLILICFKWQFSFQFQAQPYYLLWHSPLKIFTLTDDIFFIH